MIDTRDFQKERMNKMLGANYEGLKTGMFDKNNKEIKVGDKTRLDLEDGTTRVFDVVFDRVVREVSVLDGFEPGVKRMLVCGVFFVWHGNYLLPIVDDTGECDTHKMEIIDLG